MQSSKPKLNPDIKLRRDSGLADTSDADTDQKHTPEYSETEKYFPQENHQPDNAKKSVLDIVDNNGNAKSEPIIWESECKTSEKPQSEMDNVESSTTCDNIKHNTDLYNPENLNKGHYLEVQFKNDLIFDLDM